MRQLLVSAIVMIFYPVMASPQTTAPRVDRPNILFIAIDDMNDWTGFLGGHPQAVTPRMDALADRGVNFTNAHCVAPGCSPSRNALLFGLEPSSTGLYPFYKPVPDSIRAKHRSLPQFLKESGYLTFGAGKIHHGAKGWPEEWTDYHKPEWHKLEYDPEAGYQIGTSRKMAFCPTRNPLPEHPDYKVASYGIDVLGKTHEQPFFLAVGIVKPHLPFVCPKRFFELYPDPVQPPAIQMNDHDDIPWAGRALAKINDDFRFRSDEAWERVRRSYLACISWADYNVGRVLDALTASPYAENTIVILWSDHGYHQGEKRSFRKFSLWEEATRVPFIIWDTREKGATRGRVCSEAVSLIHVYRTLADLAGLTPPADVQGTSLVPQLRDPSTPVVAPALTTWGRGNYTARTEQWRFTRYFDGTEELYSHIDDPNEWTNLAGNEKWAAAKQKLAAFLPDPAKGEEAPMLDVKQLERWSITGADRPNLKPLQKKWKGRLWPGSRK